MDVERLRIDEQRGLSGPGRTGLVILCIVCVAVGFLLGLAFRSMGSSRQAIRVKTAVVAQDAGQAVKSFSAGGWIEAAVPEYPILISARVPQRLEKLAVRQGDWVAAGQPVAYLYDTDVKTKLRLAEARAREAAEKLKLAKTVHERNRGLEKGIISAEELERTEADFNSAREAHAAAQEEAELARKELSYCVVSAPEGITRLKVLNVFHSPGDWINMNEAKLVSLYDPTNLQARVDVSQANIRFVAAGTDVEIRTDANPEKTYPGNVIRIEPLAELAKNTVTVRIRVKDPDEMLFPEMVAHVSFLAQRKEAGVAGSELVVPSKAVVSSDGNSYVFVCEKDVAKKRKIEVGQISGQVTSVKSGLTRGQRVIVSETDRLSDGMKVQVE